MPVRPARLGMAAAARLHGAQRRSLPVEPARKPQTALVVREQYSLGLQPVQDSASGPNSAMYAYQLCAGCVAPSQV